ATATAPHGPLTGAGAGAAGATEIGNSPWRATGLSYRAGLTCVRRLSSNVPERLRGRDGRGAEGGEQGGGQRGEDGQPGRHDEPSPRHVEGHREAEAVG